MFSRSSRLLIAALGLLSASSVQGFALSGMPAIGLRSRAASRAAVVCSAKEDEHVSATRREALRAIGTGAAALAGFMLPTAQPEALPDLDAQVPHHLWERWALRPPAVYAAAPTKRGETKEELVALAKTISVTLKSMNEPMEFAASDWDTKREDAQKTFYLLQRSLSSGSLSQVRKTCFHLYREHVVDAKLYKEAEASYKVMTKALDKLNSDLLKASRGELEAKDLKRIPPELITTQESLDAFIKLLS
mgnify:FL=1|jgi:hypothetical protein